MPRRSVLAVLVAVVFVGAAARAAPAPGPMEVVHDEARAPSATLSFSFRTDRLGAENGAPIHADGTLYVLTPFPHTLYAFDLAGQGDRRIKWQYQPHADLTATGRSCCGRLDHGPVLHQGRLFFSTLDGRVIAVDAVSGRVAWDVVLADVGQGDVLTGPPAVVGNLVLVGSGSSDQGSRGWIAALELGSGRVLWKRYSTGPDSDVGIGPSYAASHSDTGAADLGVASWPPAGWQAGGGGVAGHILYDADARLLWHGTGPPAPWNPEQRPGTNHWTSGLFARDIDTGMARWFDTMAPHNPFSWHDGDADVLVDAAWQGEPRHLLLHPDANGHLYVIDRLSGQLLAVDRYTDSAVASVDVVRSEPHYRPDKLPTSTRPSRDICPAWSGGAAGPAAYDAEHGVLVLPVSRLCMDLEVRSANQIKGTPFVGANVRLRVPLLSGALIGWDVGARAPRWIVKERFPVVGGVVQAADGRIIYGTLDGWLKAIDGRDGRLLSAFRAPGGIVGRPAVWQADGVTQAAVVSGARGLYGMTRRDGIDPRDVTAGMGYAALVRRLPAETESAGTVLVVRLP